MIVLQTNNLTKRYGSLLAVNNVNMTINEGDIYGFIGENGAGKTTLIRLITNLISPTGGSFELFEGDKTHHIAAVVESPALYLGMNAIDNLRMQAKIVGLIDEDRITELLILVGLEDQINSKKKAKNFSLGMKQRLIIAMTLLSEPKFLLLDEPMNGLDPEGIIAIRNLIIKLNREQGITFLISSHILDELSRVATKYGFIHHGRLIHEVTKEEIKQKLPKTTELRLSSTEGVKAILKEFEIVNYELVDNKLTIYNNVDVSKLIVKFAESEVATLDVKTYEPTIEDYYIEVMGGRQ
ncbi:MAG: ABC transporter ATP-binding protein [Acholeplasmataceae bacterium]|nr:ABC transporter ATP-binding protein [Acholeplasmataceae bacterium]